MAVVEGDDAVAVAPQAGDLLRRGESPVGDAGRVEHQFERPVDVEQHHSIRSARSEAGRELPHRADPRGVAVVARRELQPLDGVAQRQRHEERQGGPAQSSPPAWPGLRVQVQEPQPEERLDQEEGGRRGHDVAGHLGRRQGEGGVRQEEPHGQPQQGGLPLPRQLHQEPGEGKIDELAEVARHVVEVEEGGAAQALDRHQQVAQVVGRLPGRLAREGEAGVDLPGERQGRGGEAEDADVEGDPPWPLPPPGEGHEDGQGEQPGQPLGEHGESDGGADGRHQRAPAGFEVEDREEDPQLDEEEEVVVDVVDRRPAARELQEVAVGGVKEGREQPGAPAAEMGADAPGEVDRGGGEEQAGQPHRELRALRPRHDPPQPQARRHQPQGERRLVQPDVIGPPVAVVVGQQRPVVERGCGRMGQQVLGDERVVALVPGVEEEVAAGVETQHQAGRQEGEDRPPVVAAAVGAPGQREQEGGERDGRRSPDQVQGGAPRRAASSTLA